MDRRKTPGGKEMKKMKLSALLLCAGLALAGCSANDDAAKDNKTEDSSQTTDTENKDDAKDEDQKSEDNTADASAKSEGTMTYQEYMDAEVDAPVVIEAYVQDKQAAADGKATIYAADPDGAYFIYNANVPEDVYAKLTPGTKIKVNGYKTVWSGETEVAEGADLEVLDDGNYIADVVDVTDLLGNEDELIKHQNQKVAFKGLVVEPAAEGSEEAYLYNWDGSGSEGDDLYFNVSKDGTTYVFTVESSLNDADSDVYKAVKNLKPGDTVDLEGYLYWYEGANPHITAVEVVE